MSMAFIAILSTFLHISTVYSDMLPKCECMGMLESYNLLPYREWGNLPVVLQKKWEELNCNVEIFGFDSKVSCEKQIERSNCQKCKAMQKMLGENPIDQIPETSNIWNAWGCKYITTQMADLESCNSIANFPNDNCTAGEWKVDSNARKMRPGRLDDTLSLEWLLICPSCEDKLTKFDCKRGLTQERSALLASRQWYSTSSQCVDVWPYTWLRRFSGSNIVFIGDASMGHLWREFVTMLFAATQTNVTFVKATTENDHDHTIAQFNTPRFRTTYYHMLHSDSIRLFYHSVSKYNLSSNDIIVFNFGSHFDDPIEYRAALEAISNDLDNFHSSSSPLSSSASPTIPKSTSPSLFFMQSTPQHFATTNGYYNRTKAHRRATEAGAGASTTESTLTAQCTSFSNLTEMASLDWRNIVAEEVLAPHPHIGIVRVAEGLYSQWDAHMETVPRSVLEAEERSEGFSGATMLSASEEAAREEEEELLDCMHWCFNPESYVLDYILRMLFNALIKGT